MPDAGGADLWWKNAIVYGVDAKTFLDSDGDGWGDLPGLTHRLDYLRDLGVTCLWLAPCYPSPMRDDGYDVTDYYGIDPRLGTPGDFVVLVRTAHSFGLRVVVDLVLNHTSDEHPWFAAARRDPGSREYGYYLWADRPRPDERGVVFPGEQTEVWSYDEAAGRYFFHRYYDFQPDLDISNPQVRDEIYKIMGFWLELGVDGFRIDSLPFLIEKSGDADPHRYLRDLRGFLTRRRGDAVLLGEANLPQPEQRGYFGAPDCPHDDSEAHLLFDFALQAKLWLALARGSAEPVRQALRGRPAVPRTCQYAVFARHHDELTLEQNLTDDERDEVFAAFAPDESSRIYGRGIRRRLAPLLDGDPARIRLVLSLVLALPGTPVLFYGDEIGLGDNLDLSGRLAVRVPMQWVDRPGGGFSPAEPWRLVRPVRPGGRYGHRRVNVAAQQSTAGTLLAGTRELIRARRDCPELGWGEWEIIDTGEPRALALRVRWRGGQVVTVHNVSDRPVEVTLDAAVHPANPAIRELVCDRRYPAVDSPDRPMPVGPYGFRWLRPVAAGG